MKKIVFILSLFSCCISFYANTPNDMQIWLKNGEQEHFNISQVDSITFSMAQQQEDDLLNKNTMPPTFAKPNPLLVNEQELNYIKSTNEFGVKCFSIMRKPGEKGGSRPIHFFSPVSLNIALGFCANGATPKGAKEITDALGFQSDNALEEMNDFFKKIYLSINSGVDSIEIHTANALWINKNTKAYRNFVETATEKYYATVRKLDFTGDPEGALDTINHWAALMTNDCIKELNINISRDTRLVINNACYFKGNWVTEFTPIGEAPFHGINDSVKSTDFMTINNKTLKYSETDMYQAVKLDYGAKSNKPSGSAGDFSSDNNAYSMIVVLPKSEHDIGEIWDSVKWDSISFRQMEGKLYMPKFKSDGGYELETKVLPQLGIQDIFGSYPNAVMDPSIYISQVRQDFFINVDEKGTEAAAVTSIVGDWGTAMPTFNMICDHPFAFVIRENSTGLILFMGEYDFVP
ncbi:MAG: hypothetical protein IJJ77_07440 [Paludibacteraceae bacterium]|nr:hypothetical protein [Paludibacteraceae bacterium]